ncbi:hypothetical protein P3T76_010303 [Phytophthora citrophthora]|uniref:Elicitin n=1 Tax=Phytophthora citrophthora TaxID=4793 RepID=A0AAD9LG73_9STRA|nr:hypothetical protein P3T76_010298 [Phytophthora citrophthora]KAK1935605.1 hypothetical protein P3T76_010300 [Phytophthora citrophthora]KAK1935608.1 hypothetical protein P3T76_010303 [Phytophthora citrophthora]
MAPIRSSLLLLLATSSALALQDWAAAAPCDTDNYSKIATAVQTLRANCASWAAYLANGGVWTCDSKCHDAVISLVDTLPDRTYGGPYGQNYKEVVENMVKSCSNSDSDVSAAPGGSTQSVATTTAIVIIAAATLLLG